MTAEPTSITYTTGGGILVSHYREATDYEDAIDRMIDMLDSRRGAIFSSNYEYPSRYTRWDTGICNPPIVISARQRHVIIILLETIVQCMKNLDKVSVISCSQDQLAI